MRSADTGSFGELLLRHTRAGDLCRTLEDGSIECFACGHRCAIKEGKDGICRVRVNRGGTLLVPWGYVSSLALDPVEKKPFFHACPGSTALSFGMLGCDYHCSYCQNWVTSQSLRDPAALASIEEMEPSDIVSAAVARRARIVTSTYNEPLITSEWAVAVFREARRSGLLTAYVSNGNATDEVLSYLHPWVDLYKVDLKGFDERRYRLLGGRLPPVLDTIRQLRALGVWLEVVTLVIPGWNDSEGELRAIGRFLASVSPDIPWHVTAFHPDYRMLEREQTAAAALRRAAEIGVEEGLRFVYAGNLPGSVGRYEDTACPGCRALLVERAGFRVVRNLIADGRCPACRAAVPGVWT
jgi:pyruvate formate lyase activating enzyme